MFSYILSFNDTQMMLSIYLLIFGVQVQVSEDFYSYPSSLW